MRLHWAELKSRPAKTDRLQEYGWSPKRGEEVPTSAAHHSVGTDHTATTACRHDGLCIEQRDRNKDDDLATHRDQSRQRTPDVSCEERVSVLDVLSSSDVQGHQRGGADRCRMGLSSFLRMRMTRVSYQ
jgi:hypothetical protein